MVRPLPDEDVQALMQKMRDVIDDPELFSLPMRSTNAGAMYEPSRDGQRFLVLTSPEAAQQSLNVIVNWPALLKKGATGP